MVLCLPTNFWSIHTCDNKLPILQLKMQAVRQHEKMRLLEWNVLFREKKLLASSEDYGKDLTGVQNLRRKHQRLEAEIHNHEPKVVVSR